MTDEPEVDKKVRIDHIQQLYAVNLFCKKQFDKCMEIFVNLDTGSTTKNVSVLVMFMCFSLYAICV